MHFELILKGWLSYLSNVQEMKIVSENTTEKQKNIPVSCMQHLILDVSTSIHICSCRMYSQHISYSFHFCRPSKEERLLFAMNESENATNSTASPTIYNYDVSPVMVSYSIFYAIIIIASLLGNITV